jgi:hypothetical protein
MTEEPTAKETGLDEATDRVIREMTQVHVSEDAVARVMARVRAADGAEQTAGGAGWLGALLVPRVSWGLMAATATLAAIVAAGVTLVAVRGGVHGTGTAATVATNAGPTEPTAPVVTPVKHGPTLNAAAGGPGSLDQRVGAAMVMTPDDDPPRAPQTPPLAAGAVPQDIRVDVTISDQSGQSKPIAKTVSMVVADRESGSVQSETRIQVLQRPPTRPASTVGVGGVVVPAAAETWRWEDLPLNVSVWPVIVGDGHVRVKVMLNYGTINNSPDSPSGTARVKKDVIAVLTDGKPLIVSSSADAATDRKVTVELKATIQR